MMMMMMMTVDAKRKIEWRKNAIAAKLTMATLSQRREPTEVPKAQALLRVDLVAERVLDPPLRMTLISPSSTWSDQQRYKTNAQMIDALLFTHTGQFI